MTGLELIATERKRQIDAGHDDDTDSVHDAGQLAEAAAAVLSDVIYGRGAGNGGSIADKAFEEHHDDPIRRLAIAGALICAEIDRLARDGAKPKRRGRRLGKELEGGK